jgi:hypothetical protein
MSDHEFVIRIKDHGTVAEGAGELTANSVLSILTNFDSRLPDRMDVECIPVETDGFGRTIYHVSETVRKEHTS